ncbi:hypothetical protein OAK57_03195 [Synechococcus sp. AH-551-N23]|nr:hypothetical protein [Synechococcus sp. AH-551-N23]
MIKEVGGSANHVIRSFKEAYPDGVVVAVLISPLNITSAVYRQRRKANIKLTLRQKIYEALDPWRVTSELLDLNQSGNLINIYHYNSICLNPNQFLDHIKVISGFNQSIPAFPTYNGVSSQTRTASKQSHLGVFAPRNKAYQDLPAQERVIIFLAATVNILTYFRYKFWCLSRMLK